MTRTQAKSRKLKIMLHFARYKLKSEVLLVFLEANWCGNFAHNLQTRFVCQQKTSLHMTEVKQEIHYPTVTSFRDITKQRQ